MGEISGATFYDALNYDGEARHYPEREESIDITQTSFDNSFLSVRVGPTSKVFVWRDTFSGPHGEYDTDQPDLTDIGGISSFTVSPNTTNGVYVRFINNTGDGAVYKLYLHISVNEDGTDVGEVEVPSSNEEYSLVGIIKDGNQHVTQVSVRNPQQSYIINGSCYFKNDDGVISLDPGPNFPSEMSYKDNGDNRFDFILDRLPPQ